MEGMFCDTLALLFFFLIGHDKREFFYSKSINTLIIFCY